MLANNNQFVITRLAKHSLKNNKKRYSIILLSIILSSFMIFSTLTIGTTYFNMLRLQEIHLNGADYDALIGNGFTDSLKERVANYDTIASVGETGYAGYAEKTDVDDTLHTGLIWGDETFWTEQMAPAITHIKGRYPQSENELMVTKEALKDCGKEELGIGDTFSLTYADKLGSHTKEFEISGIWDGYGQKNVFYVSKSFYEQTGYHLEDNGILYLSFKNNLVSEKKITKLTKELELTDRQYFIVTAATKKSISILAGLIGLILVICLSAYLLIYNILYLFFSSNTRYYGLLQAVGMTRKQVYQLLKKQMFYVGSIGIIIGLGLGMITSFGLVPFVVEALGINNKEVEIFFHPAILIFSIVIVALTIWLGARKPVKIATSVTPIEAMRCRQISVNNKTHKTKTGYILWRMAFDQLSKNKKKTTIVLLSLATSLSVFLSITTLTDSYSARTVLPSYMNSDLIVQNDTLLKENSNEWTQIMDKALIKQIQKNEGIKSSHLLLGTKIIVPWEAEFADIWMKKFYEVYTMDQSYEDFLKEYKENPEKVFSVMKGIDEKEFDYLNASLDKQVDKNAFLNGEICIIYHSGLSLDMNDLSGKHIKFILSDSNKQYDMAIAGISYDGYYGSTKGIAPTIIVSDDFIMKNVDKPYVFKANIHYKDEYDKKTENAIKDMINKTPLANDFSYESKMEDMKEIQAAQGNITGVGLGITLLLLLIGILNYVNTVSGNIQSRHADFAIMESVGMTQKQIKKMLMIEGLLFATGSILITSTIGVGITYLCFQQMNYMGSTFMIPLIPIILATFIMILICIMIPLFSYKTLIERGSIIERIRRIE